MLIKNETEYATLAEELDRLPINHPKSALLAAGLADYDSLDNRKGEWILLASGRRFWFQSVRPDDIHIEDIARGLAYSTRFNGQSSKPYTIAQHSVLVSRNLPDEFKLLGLLHDASEAFISDVTSPLKRILAPVYKPLEHSLMAVINARFGLDPEKNRGWATVMAVDMRMLATEKRDLTRRNAKWHIEYLPYDEPIEGPWGHEESERKFLEEFEVLYGNKANREVPV